MSKVELLCSKSLLLDTLKLVKVAAKGKNRKKGGPLCDITVTNGKVIFAVPGAIFPLNCHTQGACKAIVPFNYFNQVIKYEQNDEIKISFDDSFITINNLTITAKTIFFGNHQIFRNIELPINYTDDDITHLLKEDYTLEELEFSNITGNIEEIFKKWNKQINLLFDQTNQLKLFDDTEFRVKNKNFQNNDKLKKSDWIFNAVMHSVSVTQSHERGTRWLDFFWTQLESKVRFNQMSNKEKFFLAILMGTIYSEFTSIYYDHKGPAQQLGYVTLEREFLSEFFKLSLSEASDFISKKAVPLHDFIVNTIFTYYKKNCGVEKWEDILIEDLIVSARSTGQFHFDITEIPFEFMEDIDFFEENKLSELYDWIAQRMPLIH